MAQSKCLDLGYDLISSPMMMNSLFQKMQLPGIGVISEQDERLNLVAPPRTAPAAIGGHKMESRGQSRTATTLLDKELPAREVQKYYDIRRQKEFATTK